MSTQSKSPKPQGKGRVCVFCEQGNISEETYGKLISKAGVTAHYFCMLFSSGLSQNGKSEKQGILGFLPNDIMKEVKRGARLKCSYCKKVGATIGCVIRNCKKMFHLGCGRENNTLHQYFGTFSSFCPSHRQQQDVPSDDDPNIVCSICMNTVTAKPCNDTIRAPCCSKYWYHRDCVQRYATSAGLYFFKCPLCNNKDEFQNEMLTMGIYIPDQDASWEKEPHAFQELLERYGHCDAPVCKCAEGRKYDKDGSKWEIVLCEFCGSHGAHVACNHMEKLGKHDICSGCMEVDERTREEEYLLHSPPGKRKSLELLQLELASSPESSKGASPYPGPSNALRKSGLPISPTGNAKKGKRTAVTESRNSLPQAKKSRRLSKASSTVTSSMSIRNKHSEVLSSSMSSQSSDDSSDDDMPLSVKKTKLQEMKLENAWDVMRRRKLESGRKMADRKEKKKNSKAESKRKSDTEKRRESASAKVLLLEDTVKNMGDEETEPNLPKDRLSYNFSNLTDQKKDMMNKRLSLAVTKSEKEIQTRAELSKNHSKLSSSAVRSTVNGTDKNKQRKLKRESLEHDKGQTTLTNWLKPKAAEPDIKPPASENKAEDKSTEQNLNRTPQKGNKKPVIMEWKGKQLLIRSPRVLLRRSRSRNTVALKPKCLEIDMTDSKGSSEWKKDIDLLTNIDSDVRVTRKMVDIDQIEIKISSKKGKQSINKSSTARNVAKTDNQDTKELNSNEQKLSVLQGDRNKEMNIESQIDTGNSGKNKVVECDSSSKHDSDLDIININETPVNKKLESSPAKNLRARANVDKTKTKSTDQAQLLKDPERTDTDNFEHSAGKIPVKLKHHNSKSLNRNDSPAKSLRPRHKKDLGKQIAVEHIDSPIEHIDINKNELTPTLQSGNCFDFDVQREKAKDVLPHSGGSPLIQVKDSSQFGSVIIINESFECEVKETENNAKSNLDNLERLKMYKPVALSDSPAKNLRKRSHQADSTKEVTMQKKDFNSASSVNIDHLERLKKYRPKVDHLNFNNTGKALASYEQGEVENRKNTLRESQTFTKCVNKQKDNSDQQANVLWHLEGTRQLITEQENKVKNSCGFGCENTCPNPQTTMAGNFIQNNTESMQNKDPVYSSIFRGNINELGDKLQTSVSKVYFSDHHSVADSQMFISKQVQSGLDNDLSINAAARHRSSPRSSSNAYKNFSMQDSVSFEQHNRVSVNPVSPKSSFLEKSITDGYHTRSLEDVQVNQRPVLNGIKNSSAVKLRSSPRSVKNVSSSTAHKKVHMSDKTSMVEYYSASFNTEEKEDVSNDDLVENHHYSDDDSDIVELPMLGSVM